MNRPLSLPILGSRPLSSRRWRRAPLNPDEILEFERTWWKQQGRKEEAIGARFGVSAPRYYRALDRLIDTPEALRLDPLLVRRLRRRRAERRRQRVESLLGVRN